jgi:hypothetical protein
MLGRFYPYALLALLGLIFFFPLALHPGQVLYSDHSDMLAEHVPAKRFLVRAWQETGELPLWCPHTFCGAPFVHDVQVGIFYPPHCPLLLLPEERVGAALSWLVVLHVILGGCLAYAYARQRGLGIGAALVTGLGYEFAGKWLFHVLAAGHYILIGLAWLPLALLLLERAVQRRSVVLATWAGATFALIALGTHPQWTFYAGLLTIPWTLGVALEDAGLFGGGTRSPERTALALLRWAGLGAWAALVAGGLCAVQGLPTLEAASQSSRSLGLAGAQQHLARAVVVAWHALPRLFGPVPAPSGVSWEDRGGVSVLWLTAAILAPVLCRGRVRWDAAVCLGLFLYGMGGATFFDGLPWFRVFRSPIRTLVLAALPLAFLAGATTHALFEASPTLLARRRATVLALLTVGVAVLVLTYNAWTSPRSGAEKVPVYWLALPLLLVGFFWVLSRKAGTRRIAFLGAWGVLLLADLWALAWPLVEAKPDRDLYAPSACVNYVREQADERDRVLDRCVRETDQGHSRGSCVLGEGDLLPMIYGLDALGGYNPLDVLRYREYLQMIGDEDGPLLPLQHRLGFPVLLDFPLRNKRLLDLLGVRYLLQPRDPDARPVDGEKVVDDPAWHVVFEDPHPRAYCFSPGGMRDLPPYVVCRNNVAFPRAFVVPEAKLLPERSRVLATLKETDFRKTVLLEDWHDDDEGSNSGMDNLNAEITEYHPNRVMINVRGHPAGWLVLADVWYPGWTCTIDGRPVEVQRGDFLFRAVRLPEGAREVVFTFAPESYRRGRVLSWVFAGLVGFVGIAGVVNGWRRSRAITFLARSASKGV